MYLFFTSFYYHIIPCYTGGYCGAIRSVYWSKQELNATMVHGKRTYTAQFDAPEDGRWVAYMIDFKFVNKHAFPIVEGEKQVAQRGANPEQEFGGVPHDFGRFFQFTTQVSVWPNEFPYADCTGAECGENIL